MQLAGPATPSTPYHEYTEIATANSDRIHALLHEPRCWPRTPPTTQRFDVYALKKQPPSLNYHPHNNHSICESGDEGPEGHQALTQKIRVASTSSQRTVLCMVYTSRPDRLQGILETWGPKCDGFFAASPLDLPLSPGVLHLRHFGPESYDNMWSKIRSMWEYAFEHYVNDFDYFHIGGDDHYVIVENLQAMVGNWKEPTWNVSEPLFLGGSMADFPKVKAFRYCSGGSGYTLNRAALKLLMEELWYHPDCFPYARTSQEDRMMARCFRIAGIQCFDTNDAFNETRYHAMDAQVHASWVKRLRVTWYPHALEDFHGIAQKERLGQISESSVSFHLKPAKAGNPVPEMRRYHALVYGLCERK